MKRTFFFPTDKPSQLLWLKNYKGQLAIVGAAHGMTAPVIGTLQADCTMLMWLIESGVADAETYFHSMVSYLSQMMGKNTGNILPDNTSPELPTASWPPLVDFNALPRILASVQWFKNVPVSAAEEQTLQIVGSVFTPAAVPDAKVKHVVEGGVVLKWVKTGHKNTRVRFRLKGTTTWGPGQDVMGSKYIFTQALAVPGVAEWWEFQFAFKDSDIPDTSLTWGPVVPVQVMPKP